jgi:hypothetical protein
VVSGSLGFALIALTVSSITEPKGVKEPRAPEVALPNEIISVYFTNDEAGAISVINHFANSYK